MREGKYQSKKLEIEFHYTYLFMAFGFVLTGYYLNLIVFTMLILIHELGHYWMARIFGVNVLRVVIYPYGGKTVLEDFVNLDIYVELLVAMAGVLVQFLFYLGICFFHDKGMIRDYTVNLFTLYSNQMIFFNLFPIYPLDGGRIVNLLLCRFLPFYIANLFTVVGSFLVIILICFFHIYQCNYSNLMVMFLLVRYLIEFYRKRKFLYHRFLLERYLYKVTFPEVKVIKEIKGMYKNRIHFFMDNKRYVTEKERLDELFLNYNKRE